MPLSKMPEPPKLGKKIYKIRKDLKLSLDQLAERSGVSKGMLSQVEKENTNPTLATLWKIAHGLNVPIEELISGGGEAKLFEVTRKENLPTLKNEDKSCAFNIISTLDMEGLEVYELEIEKNGTLSSKKHFPGTEEILYISKGKVEVHAGEKNAILKEGDVIRYNADVDHSIRNLSGGPAKLFMLEIFK